MRIWQWKRRRKGVLGVCRHFRNGSAVLALPPSAAIGSLMCNVQVARSLRPYNGDLKKVWGSTLFHLDDVIGPSGALGPLGIRGMPDVFTPFKEKVSGSYGWWNQLI